MSVSHSPHVLSLPSSLYFFLSLSLFLFLSLSLSPLLSLVSMGTCVGEHLRMSIVNSMPTNNVIIPATNDHNSRSSCESYSYGSYAMCSMIAMNRTVIISIVWSCTWGTNKKKQEEGRFILAHTTHTAHIQHILCRPYMGDKTARQHMWELFLFTSPMVHRTPTNWYIVYIKGLYSSPPPYVAPSRYP